MTPLQPNRFHHSDASYDVYYSDGGSAKEPLGPSWKVTNLHPNGAAKQSPAYTLVRAYDLNEDGEADISMEAPRYDLLLEHVARDASLWVRSVPVALGDDRKDLSVMAQRYLQAVANHGEVAAPFGVERKPQPKSRLRFSPMYGGALVREQPVVINTTTYVARSSNSYACSLANRPAHRLDFVVAPAVAGQDSAQVEGNHGSVVLVLKDKGTTFRGRTFPTMLLVGLSSSSADAAALESDFRQLLAGVALQGTGESDLPSCSAPLPQVSTSGGESARPDDPHLPATVPPAPSGTPEVPPEAPPVPSESI
ncbi:MAG: hypothetical protein QM778_23040 [Myxococcales bacterium]